MKNPAIQQLADQKKEYVKINEYELRAGDEYTMVRFRDEAEKWYTVHESGLLPASGIFKCRRRVADLSVHIKDLGQAVYECCNCIPQVNGRVEICPKHKLLIAKRKKSLTHGSD